MVNKIEENNKIIKKLNEEKIILETENEKIKKNISIIEKELINKEENTKKIEKENNELIIKIENEENSKKLLKEEISQLKLTK